MNIHAESKHFESRTGIATFESRTGIACGNESVTQLIFVPLQFFVFLLMNDRKQLLNLVHARVCWINATPWALTASVKLSTWFSAQDREETHRTLSLLVQAKICSFRAVPKTVFVRVEGTRSRSCNRFSKRNADDEQVVSFVVGPTKCV